MDSHGWLTRTIALEVKSNESKASTSTELEKRFVFDTVDVLNKFLEDMKSLEFSEKVRVSFCSQRMRATLYPCAWIFLGKF